MLPIEGHDQGINNEVLPRGMKIYSEQFNGVPYYDYLEIVHLFNTIHMMKNVIDTLQKILDGRRNKDKFVNICNDNKGDNHEMQSVICSNSDGDAQNINALPWLLTQQQRKDVKEVIEKIKFSTGFCSNMKSILTKKGELSGVKTHDWNTFIKVIIWVYIFLYWYTSCQYFLSSQETNNDLFVWLQYVLPLSLPNNLKNNIKQVIYDIGNI